MNVGPREQEQPDGGEPGGDGGGTLKVLEQALREALASVPRDRVVRAIAGALPAEVLVEESTRRHGGKVRKVSVSMPEELTEAVRARTGAGGFSRYVTDAVQQQVRQDLLGDLLDELEAEYGPVEQELVEQARREWPDFEES